MLKVFDVFLYVIRYAGWLQPPQPRQDGPVNTLGPPVE